jgi:hypothetical protein
VNVRTQSPPGATVIVTPVALSTSVLHAPLVTVAALTDVETNPTVIEAAKTNRQTDKRMNTSAKRHLHPQHLRSPNFAPAAKLVGKQEAETNSQRDWYRN